ncbi:uncharacterized protein F5147DRAFT_771483 [Suillus discolor]|uniref:Uncharacterized protein n=1 Tax=Suillus discolor TaxID=1912936 RepID=A0A9P7FC46_9AGAM|nr:uncharacterized protein F5147DRAFT_771483 [Suillus discolor]KAG2111910.1 hypothetical protein F5147DRAFT_771483 [Suillus discolor]
MSHILQPAVDSSSSEWDDQDADSGRIVSVPGPGASKGELLETLKVLQIQMQKLQDENRNIKEEKKTLHAKKPKQKWRTDTHDEFSIHEDTISIYARKYGMMVEMFLSSDLLNKCLPESLIPFDSIDHYKTGSTQESTFIDELYHHFPESLHKVMESSYFSDLVTKCIADTHANEIKKLRGVAGDIFELPSKYVTNTSYNRANIIEIQRLLGVTSLANPTYKTFPPVLFPGLVEDKSLKTVFGNWKLLAQALKASLRGITSLHQTSSGSSAHMNSMKWSVRQVTPGSIAWAAVIAIFLLLPDTEFSSTGIGKRPALNYRELFFTYKKVLVSKWSTRRITLIVTNINHYIFQATKLSALDLAGQEDHTDMIDRALTALDMESSTDESDMSDPETARHAAIADLERVSGSISQPNLSTLQQHTARATSGPVVDVGVAAAVGPPNVDSEAAPASGPEPDIVQESVSSAVIVDEVPEDAEPAPSGRWKQAKTRGRKAAASVSANHANIRSHK